MIIRKDGVHEDVESFTIAVELDTFVLQSRIIVEPNVTEIFILDNDGMIVYSPKLQQVYRLVFESLIMARL